MYEVPPLKSTFSPFLPRARNRPRPEDGQNAGGGEEVVPPLHEVEGRPGEQLERCQLGQPLLVQPEVEHQSRHVQRREQADDQADREADAEALELSLPNA